MIKSTENRKRKLGLRLAAALVCLAGLVSISGCIAAGAVAVYYMATEKVITVSMEVNAPAPDVYHALVKTTKEKSPLSEIIKEDESKLFFEGKKVGEKGEELWGAWQVTAVSRKKSHVLFSAFGDNWPMEQLQQTVRDNLKQFCDDMGFKCVVVETEEEQKML